MNEWKIDHEAHIFVTDKIDNSVSISPESRVEKRVHARSPDEDDDDSPTNKKMKLHKQAYDDVLHAFNAESHALSHVKPHFLSFITYNDSEVCMCSSCLVFLFKSRNLIMQDLLEECNIKTDLPLVEAFTTAKIVEPRSRLLPEDLKFRPTDLEMATFLKQKVLGQPIEACILPEERHDIFSIPPRDLPGYPEETHWYYYCMKPKGQNPRSLWTRFREDTAVFDPEENCVGIKRRFTIIELEEDSNDIFLPDEEEPPMEDWFIKEISLPSSVADTDLVLCHVILKKREKTNEEEEEYYEEEEEEEEDE
ncbi:hypothetical protein N665_0201s0351 [Sinapis alba]|nr:hypothetical protein N665_0201s0351 [Sinapis alba]